MVSCELLVPSAIGGNILLVSCVLLDSLIFFSTRASRHDIGRLLWGTRALWSLRRQSDGGTSDVGVIAFYSRDYRLFRWFLTPDNAHRADFEECSKKHLSGCIYIIIS